MTTPLTMHSALVPPVLRTLRALSAILAKGAAHCEARGIDPQAFLTARLFPDMFALTRQVQIATDMVKGGVARLADVEMPAFPDTETTFEQLQDRVAWTIAFIEGVPADRFEGSEGRHIVLKLRTRTEEFDGYTYLTTWVLPNFHFHVTTTYNLLRHGGVALGKPDFLGANVPERA